MQCENSAFPDLRQCNRLASPPRQNTLWPRLLAGGLHSVREWGSLSELFTCVVLALL